MNEEGSKERERKEEQGLLVQGKLNDQKSRVMGGWDLEEGPGAQHVVPLMLGQMVKILLEQAGFGPSQSLNQAY